MEEMKLSLKDNFLHVYGQTCPEEEVHIAGSEAGLRLLRDKLNEALGEKKISPDQEAIANDDLEYDIVINLVDDYEDLRRLAAPYVKSFAQDKRADQVRYFPWQIF